MATIPQKPQKTAMSQGGSTEKKSGPQRVTYRSMINVLVCPAIVA